MGHCDDGRSIPFESQHRQLGWQLPTVKLGDPGFTVAPQTACRHRLQPKYPADHPGEKWAFTVLQSYYMMTRLLCGIDQGMLSLKSSR